MDKHEELEFVKHMQEVVAIMREDDIQDNFMHMFYKF